MARKPKASEPVEIEELKDAVLRLMVTEFGDRPLTWETVERALALAIFEVKQHALKAISEQEAQARKKAAT